MSVVLVPEVTLNIKSGQTALEDAPQSILFVGQKTAAGSVTQNTLITNIGISGEEGGLFGDTSFLASGIRSFRKINKLTRVDAIALDDNAAGVVATATLTVTGTATETGTVDISIQSGFFATFTVAISQDDTAEQIATAINAAISASSEDLIFTNGVATNVVTLTCVHKGTIGNKIPVKIKGSVAGTTITLVGFANGLTDPVLTNVFDPAGEKRYQTVCYPENYGSSELKTFLDNRFNVINGVEDGVGFLSVIGTDTQINAQSVLADSPSITILPVVNFSTTIQTGSGLVELDYVVQAYVSAIRTLRLTDDAPVSQFIAGSTANSRSAGGIEYATIPYHNTPIPFIKPVDTQTWWTKAQQKNFKNDGVGMIGNNINENQIILGDLVTTDHALETAFKFLNVVDGVSAAREFFTNNNRARYAQSQLSQGDLIGNTPMTNEGDIRTFQTKLYSDLSELAIVPAGSAAEKFFKDNLKISIDFAAGAVTLNMKLIIVSAVRAIVGDIIVTFDFNG